ncbi:MAG: argininosuccinate lyase [Nitrospirae bacterium]|nr:MAG: argininosuccinate lyase [Nitrospirota bacterium]
MKKPWAGRFMEKTAKEVEDFTESVSFDWRLWPYDIQGSIAHVRMLKKTRILSSEDAERIMKGLEEIGAEISQGRFRWREELEDVHMNIESALLEKIGPVAGKLHTARSRNDQVAVDLRLYLRDQIQDIIKELKRLIRVVLSHASRHTDTLLPGYTHLQRAQPVSLAHHLVAYAEMFLRDMDRYGDALKRTNTLPLGSCALAGTTLKTDREYLARVLRFERISENSMDGVSDRDFVIEFLSASAIFMMHCSRLAEELVLWSTEEFSFIELPDAYTTGSSIMPQKKNPDVAELIRGKTGRVYGSLMALLTIMKGLPLAYNRDMQEDKPPLFDTVDTVRGVLGVLVPLIKNIKFRRKRMKDALRGGYILSTDVAEYLVKKGMPFRQAHEVTGSLVRYCLERGKELHELSLEEYKRFSELFGDDILSVLDLEESIRRRISRGGPAPEETKRQIQRIRSLL